VKRSGPLRRTGRVNPVSDRRKQRDEILPARRAQVARRAGGRCEFWTAQDGRCRSRMTDVHHLAGREGPDPHRLSNLVGLCRYHHEHIESHWRAWSYENGWLVRRNHGGNTDGTDPT